MSVPFTIERLGVTLPPGSVVGLVGRSGAGKTTLANTVFGQARTHRLAMVFQEPLLALNPTMRVVRQVAEAVQAHGIARGTAARQRALESLATVDLDALAAHRYPHELSGGMRQRVLIAMATAIQPDVIIADEPTTALDPALQSEILDLLVGLCRTAGTSLLLISHDLPLVARYCDRVLALEHGRLVADGPAADVLAARYVPPAPRTAAAPTSDATPLVEIGHLTVQFGATRVLDDVHLTIARGACLGIVGPSGAGKTTLVRVIAGLQPPTSGDVRLDGTYLSTLPNAARRTLRRQVQLIPQDAGASLTPHRTVLALVQEGIEVHGLAQGAEAERRARDAIAAVGLDPALAERPARALSSGERQRAAIARAIAIEPELLLCDEPVANVDAEAREHLLALLDRLRAERHLTLVVVSHDHEAIRQLASGVIVMQHGRVVPSAQTLTSGV